MNKLLIALSLLVATMFFGSQPLKAQNSYNRHVEVINGSSYTLRSFYASNIDSPVWEEDILGVSVLAPGHEVNVDIDDGTGHCRYDLKAVFSNGQQVIRRNVDVCRLRSWTLYD
jgi:hypothetical protein